MLAFENVSFSYDKNQVLLDLSFTLERGELLAVMGPSGCGKSTLLSLVAGLKKPQSGKIVSDFQSLSVAFQEPRLFPWLTVYENLAATLAHPKEQRNRILDALAAVSLSDAADLYPDELSGGMKSRVSLARALVFGGDLFLLDEPFSALDEELRTSLAKQLRTHLKEKGASAILVTHHPGDAALFADRTLTLSPLTPRQADD